MDISLTSKSYRCTFAPAVCIGWSVSMPLEFLLCSFQMTIHIMFYGWVCKRCCQSATPLPAPSIPHPLVSTSSKKKLWHPIQFLFSLVKVCHFLRIPPLPLSSVHLWAVLNTLCVWYDTYTLCVSLYAIMHFAPLQIKNETFMFAFNLIMYLRAGKWFWIVRLKAVRCKITD